VSAPVYVSIGLAVFALVLLAAMAVLLLSRLGRLRRPVAAVQARLVQAQAVSDRIEELNATFARVQDRLEDNRGT
jgi:HAMP domain-containing protein